MKPLPLYLLEVLFCSGLLLAFYHLMLVRRVLSSIAGVFW